MNINRDYLATLNVKTSKVTLDRKMIFYTTDKKTMNILVKLVFDMSNNEFIKEYVTLEKASDYRVVLVLIAPNKELFHIDAELLEEGSLYLFNLGNEYIDKIGDWTCELRVYSTVDNPNDEIVTSNSFKYTVKASITHNLDDEVYDTEQIDIISNLTERVIALEEIIKQLR